MPDDDGTTWLDQGNDLFVLGEWTHDGQLIPAIIGDCLHYGQQDASGCIIPVDPAAALAARNYRINPDALPGWCQIIELIPDGSVELPPRPCPSAAERAFGIARLCTAHYRAVTTPLRRQ